jgi:hypothetical protein
MIKSKSKQRAQLISSRKKNVKDKTIIIHCLWHSKATEEEWFLIFCLRWCLFTIVFFDHLMSLHSFLITIRLQIICTTIRFIEYLIQIIKYLVRDDIWFDRVLEKSNCQMLYDVIINSSFHVRFLLYVDWKSIRIFF